MQLWTTMIQKEDFNKNLACQEEIVDANTNNFMITQTSKDQEKRGSTFMKKTLFNMQQRMPWGFSSKKLISGHKSLNPSGKVNQLEKQPIKSNSKLKKAHKDS